MELEETAKELVVSEHPKQRANALNETNDEHKNENDETELSKEQRAEMSKDMRKEFMITEGGYSRAASKVGQPSDDNLSIQDHTSAEEQYARICVREIEAY